MSNNKIVIGFTIIILIVILVVPTIFKVKKNEDELINLVLMNKIKDASNKCHNEDKCPGNIIYLKDLYNLNYLDKLVDPDTKEFINEESYVEIKNEETIVNIIK